MNGDLLYTYFLDLGWFFLVTCAVMVSTAMLIVVLEDSLATAPGTANPDSDLSSAIPKS